METAGNKEILHFDICRFLLNKTDEQNTTYVANIFVDKDIEKRKNMSFNSQQSDGHM